MAYRSRSKYTAGGGVLVIFEQVSRYVSLSVFGWACVSLLLIFFAADGRVTDSLDLKIIRGIFSEPTLFGTAAVLISVSGLVGGIVSLPAAVVLLSTRRYVDLQSGKRLKHAAALRLKLFKTLPVIVLCISHIFALLLFMSAAPQLSRTWFGRESFLAHSMTRAHFFIASLSRSSYAKLNYEPADKKNHFPKNNPDSAQKFRHLHVFLLPADLLESEGFANELNKLRGAQRVPFVMTKSDVIEQIGDVFSDASFSAGRQLRSALNSPSTYGNVSRDGNSTILLSLSPQLRLGKQLRRYGADSISDFSARLFINESQRRIIQSQVHIFGLFRAVDVSSFLGSQFDWLKIISDDVLRLRQSGQFAGEYRDKSNTISIIQLGSLESQSQNVKTPFRPIAWPDSISSFEKQLVLKNIIRELSQYLHDHASEDNSLWAFIPYADDKRTLPKSAAVLKMTGNAGYSSAQLGAQMLNHKSLGRLFSYFLSPEVKRQTLPRAAEISTSSERSDKALMCSEIELSDLNDGFEFLSSEVRERNLGVLINSLAQLPEGDLKFLGRNSMSVLAREPAFGLFCNFEKQSVRQEFLFKFRRNEHWMRIPSDVGFFESIFLPNEQPDGDSLSRVSKFKRAPSNTKLSLDTPPGEAAFKAEILADFIVFRPKPEGQNGSSGKTEWQRLNDGEARQALTDHAADLIRVLETAARERIR